MLDTLPCVWRLAGVHNAYSRHGVWYGHCSLDIWVTVEPTKLLGRFVEKLNILTVELKCSLGKSLYHHVSSSDIMLDTVLTCY
eukprot:1193195-Prorocentrum_minimum.AAC.4